MNFKPNYLSAMNYLFQTIGVVRGGVPGSFDYSSFALDFDEHVVNGAHGVSQNADLQDFGTAVACDSAGRKEILVPRLSQKIRWDCSDNDPPDVNVPFDVNRDIKITLLRGRDDWASLNLGGSVAAAGAPVLQPRPEREWDVRSLGSYAALVTPKVQAIRRAEGVAVSWARIPLQRVVAYEVLRQQPGHKSFVVWQTRRSSFVDKTAQPGIHYDYSVRLVLAGFSESTIQALIQEGTRLEAIASNQLKSILPKKLAMQPKLLRSRPSPKARS